MNKLIISLILFLMGCSKPMDYSYLNTDRRPQVIRISERYTEKWKWIKTVNDTLNRETRWQDYINIKPDTLISSCSIDKIDSNFKIEIRKYKILQ